MTMWDFFNNIVQKDSSAGFFIFLGLVIIVCVAINGIKDIFVALSNKKK